MSRFSSKDPLQASKILCKHFSKPSLWDRTCGFVSKGALHLVRPLVGIPRFRSVRRRALNTELWMCFRGRGSCQSESSTSTVKQPELRRAQDFMQLLGLCRSFFVPLLQASLKSLKHSSLWREDSKESDCFSLDDVSPNTMRTASRNGAAAGELIRSKLKPKCLRHKSLANVSRIRH